MEKSANRRWKESGSTLSFKEWIDRDNKKKESKGYFGFDSTISPDTSVINSSLGQVEGTFSGYKTPASASNTTLGLDNNVLILASVLIAGSIGFYLYKKLKK